MSRKTKTRFTTGMEMAIEAATIARSRKMFTRDQFANEGDDAGVFISGLGSALVTFCAMQDHAVTVAEAAKIFNTTPEVIREAVNDAMWIGYYGPDDDPTKQKLELDGE